jgi:hypothetical protein
MIYITDEDLQTDSFQRFIDDSTADFANAKNASELKVIGIVKTLLKGRYNVDTIFAVPGPIRDEFLVDIITKLVLHKIFGRNAARKVPSDVKDNHDWAMKQLKEINAGKVDLDLPKLIDDSGNAKGKTVWGNNSNKNFYI